MKFPILLLMALPLIGAMRADDFKVESVIHPVVAKLGPPKSLASLSKGFMAISTSSDEAAAHVVQGMSRLNTSWDFEAYRHFCAAARLDPDCVMAYWGIALSLAGSEHEFFEQRKVAVDRMLDLLEAGKGTDMEQGYVEAVARLLTTGVGQAGMTFQAISKKFPNDVQSRLMSYFLLRDGFDTQGKPRVGQLKANVGILETLKAHPENISVMAFWVNSQSEAPLIGQGLRKDVLPIARKLARLHPEYPPFLLMLTHVEARCGNASLAIEAATKAEALYESYMEEEKVSVMDCEGWLRAKIYLANLHVNKGHHEKAIVEAKELAGIEIPKERVFSRGAGLLLWEGRTIGGRLMMGRSDKASFYAGQKILETLPEEQWYKDKSFALAYRDCLAFYLGVRVALSVKDLKNAKIYFTDFGKRAAAFEAKRSLASKTSTYANWLRAANTLGMAMEELKGLIAEQEEGGTKLSAVNWYRSAIDRQGRPTNLLPPTIDYPLEIRLGDFYMKAGKFEQAGKTYREGLNMSPNHIQALEGYHKALLKLGKTDSAEIVAKRIAAVKG